MNIQGKLDSRQPWHMIAHIDGGNAIVNRSQFENLVNRINTYQENRRELIAA